MSLWQGEYKIPWHEPDFSRRMLAEHLSQNHDLASRRTVWIEQQTAWIHAHACGGRQSRILDLGCGPGLYASRLAALGHHVTGIDLGPASIEYARNIAPNAELVLGDFREIDLGGPYDLAMLLYGEMNIFPPCEIRAVLARVRAALAPGAALLLEIQPPELVERMGRAEAWTESAASGLFSDGPYELHAECAWHAAERVAVRRFLVDSAEGRREYRDTAQAWPEPELRALLESAGFGHAELRPDFPSDGLALWRAWV